MARSSSARLGGASTPRDSSSSTRSAAASAASSEPSATHPVARSAASSCAAISPAVRRLQITHTATRRSVGAATVASLARAGRGSTTPLRAASSRIMLSAS